MEYNSRNKYFKYVSILNIGQVHCAQSALFCMNVCVVTQINTIINVELNVCNVVTLTVILYMYIVCLHRMKK